jgi:hypothetical protein
LRGDYVDDCVPEGLEREDEGGGVVEAEAGDIGAYACVESVGAAGELFVLLLVYRLYLRGGRRCTQVISNAIKNRNATRAYSHASALVSCFAICRVRLLILRADGNGRIMSVC